MHRSSRTIGLRVALVTGLVLQATPLRAQEEELSADLLAFESLLETQLSTASKHQQTMREAPASATVVTAEEIAAFGYVTLAEVLENVAGFYTSYDRTYVSLGVRGFSQPGGYNNQVLVLIDGHSINENLYDGARIGTGFPLDLNVVDRVEIVRGPGSALYGSNAVFAVINIITKSNETLDGLVASGSVGSYRSREAGITLGTVPFRDLDLTLSGIWSDYDGQDLYYREFDTPGTNHGIAEGLDWENRYGVLGVLRHRGLRLSAMSWRREKAIPTAVFEGRFNENATVTDQRSFVELSLDGEIGPGVGVFARGYFDDFGVDRTFTTVDFGATEASQAGRWIGGESRLRWDPGSAFRLIAGSEFRSNVRSGARAEDTGGIRLDFDTPWWVGSAYAQAELQLGEGLALTLGTRFDHYSTVGGAVTPRGALVFHAAEHTTFKFLYGEAFRAPNQWELNFEIAVNSFFKKNPDLQPERARTLELVWEQRLARGVSSTLSLYNYRMDGLIQWTVDPADGVAMHGNVSTVDARGVEVGLNARLGPGLSATASYVMQRAEDRDLLLDRPDSPRHLVRFATVARPGSGTAIALNLQYDGSRQTIRGFPTDPYLLANLALSSGDLFGAVALSLRVNNLLDSQLYHPGGPEHAQVAIQQNGRNLRLRVDLSR